MYKPIKGLGQNFLLDFDTTERMIDYLDLKKNGLVVEIGAGLGVLTQALSDRTLNTSTIIHAVEIDERFVGKLKIMFLENPNINVIKADILVWFQTFKPEKDYKVLGSLPYYITSPIIHSIVRHKQRPETCVLLMQKEVANKICSKSPKASYLSTYIQTFFDATLLEVVTKDKFDPSPKVDGAIVKFVRKHDQEISNMEINKYEDFLHKGFSKPRKMLNKVFSKDILESLKTDDKLRPQHIKVKKWVELFKKMKD